MRNMYAAVGISPKLLHLVGRKFTIELTIHPTLNLHVVVTVRVNETTLRISERGQT